MLAGMESYIVMDHKADHQALVCVFPYVTGQSEGPMREKQNRNRMMETIRKLAKHDRRIWRCWRMVMDAGGERLWEKIARQCPIGNAIFSSSDRYPDNLIRSSCQRGSDSKIMEVLKGCTCYFRL